MNPDDVRAMCKLPTCQIIYKNAAGEIAKTEIRRIVEDFLKRNNPIEILINGKFKSVKDVIKLKLENEDILEITLNNGLIDKMTMDHPSVIIKDGKLERIESRNLEIGDEFPIAKSSYEGRLGDFDLGRIVGLFIGDGWLSHNNATVNFVFNKNEKRLAEFIELISIERFATYTTIHSNERHNYFKISIASRALSELIKEYVRGGNSLDKRINSKTFARSIDFRKGVIIGVVESDGFVDREKDCIVLHLGNGDLVLDTLMLARTLGVNTTYYESKNRTGNKKKIGYNLRFAGDIPEWFKNHFKISKRKNLKYKEYRDFYGVKIKKIEKIKYTGYVYDFEIGDKQHLFQLANGIITHNCCRLRLDKKELYRRAGGLFGAGALTGSIGVVTINLPRIGYLSKTRKDFFDRLAGLMDLAKDSLEIKRKVLERFMNMGLYPYSTFYLSGVKKMRGNYFGNHFSTIGLVGMNEALLNFMGVDIGSNRGRKFTLEILDFMRNRLINYQEETDSLYNLEATPAEGTAYRLALNDKAQYPDIIAAGTKKTPYYTNSTMLPVNYTNDVFEALKLQDEIQTKYTGGVVFHAFMGEKINQIESVKSLVKTVFSKFHLPYFTLTPTFSICPHHGYLSGEYFICPKCVVKQPCEVYSRVVGYIRPVQQWHSGKQQEFKDRKLFKIR
ncbi:MAG: anaerobic ribonucleoside-triphosphate reductase [Patescibacteria group bacterium]